ncbi:hypothetical protein MRX96_039426 [Rhipicephalus microplus]
MGSELERPLRDSLCPECECFPRKAHPDAARTVPTVTSAALGLGGAAALRTWSRQARNRSLRPRHSRLAQFVVNTPRRGLWASLRFQPRNGMRGR